MRNPFRKKASPLPPCPEGLEDILVTIHVRFHHPMDYADDPGEPPAQGYYQVLGLRIPPEGVRNTLASMITDGEIGWLRTEWRTVEPSALKASIRRNVTLPQSDGVWFRSGRILYGRTGEEESEEAQDEAPPSARPN